MMKKTLSLLSISAAVVVSAASFAGTSSVNLPKQSVNFTVNVQIPNTQAQVKVALDASKGPGNSQSIVMTPTFGTDGSATFAPATRYLQVSVPAGIGGKDVQLEMSDDNFDAQKSQHDITIGGTGSNKVVDGMIVKTSLAGQSANNVTVNGQPQVVDDIQSADFGKSTADIQMQFTMNKLTAAQVNSLAGAGNASDPVNYTITPVLNQ